MPILENSSKFTDFFEEKQTRFMGLRYNRLDLWSNDHNRFEFLWHAYQGTPNPSLTREPTIIELHFELNRIESYIVLMGKRTYFFTFIFLGLRYV